MCPGDLTNYGKETKLMNQLAPIRKTRLYQEIIDRIQQLVGAGELRPGDRLPSERELADRFGVSRGAVREAMTVLEAAGLIEVRPGSGVYVRGQCGVAVQLPHAADNLLEVLEVRSIVEPEAAALAAQRASDEDLAEIGRAYEALGRAVAAGEVGAEEDFAFHHAVCRAARNHVLLDIMDCLAQRVREALHRSRSQSLSMPGRSLIVLQEHRAILDAITRGSAEDARDSMTEHIEAVRQKLFLEVGGDHAAPGPRSGESRN
jgi:GntR family transcriptional repressor for pyruvate dehydrogenase complex